MPNLQPIQLSPPTDIITRQYLLSTDASDLITNTTIIQMPHRNGEMPPDLIFVGAVREGQPISNIKRRMYNVVQNSLAHSLDYNDRHMVGYPDVILRALNRAGHDIRSRSLVPDMSYIAPNLRDTISSMEEIEMSSSPMYDVNYVFHPYLFPGRIIITSPGYGFRIIREDGNGVLCEIFLNPEKIFVIRAMYIVYDDQEEERADWDGIRIPLIGS